MLSVDGRVWIGALGSMLGPDHSRIWLPLLLRARGPLAWGGGCWLAVTPLLFYFKKIYINFIYL
jgi:hypothetical protein